MDLSLSLDNKQAPQTNNEDEQTLDIHKSHDTIIATLEKENGWGFVDHLYLYQGFWFIRRMLTGIILAQEQFIAQPNDILLCSCPKAGTTWLKALAFAIVTRNRFDTSSSPLLTTISHNCVPFIETGLVQETVKRDPQLPLLATHIPYSLLPKSIVSSGCKIVYIYRDPKDSFISLWHFVHKLTPENKETIALEEAFKQFTSGVSGCGPFWNHILEYLKASLDRQETIFIIKYEDLKTNSVYYVKKLAEFMGYSFTLEEEKNGIIDNIINLCSFENLISLDVNKGGIYHLGTSDGLSIKNSTFFRKGVVGDWKNYFTAQMADVMDNITKEKFGVCDFKYQS